MPTKTLITAREFEAVAGRLGPCELVRGEVIALSPAGPDHSQITATATGLLWEWARRTRRGRVYSGEAGLIVETDPDTVRGADVAYFSFERLPKGMKLKGFIHVAPNLVVEVLGEGHGWSELERKVGEYLRMGVDRVWVINPSSERVHVFRPDAEPVVLGRGEKLADEDILPGFECTVDDLVGD